jgi:hypothetical protein
MVTPRGTHYYGEIVVEGERKGKLVISAGSLLPLRDWPFKYHNLMLSLPSARSLLVTCRPWTITSQPYISALNPFALFARGRGQLAPKKMTHIKRHKGRVPIPIGGSTKGTTLAYGEWGIRINGQGARLTAKQLTVAEEVVKRKLKVLKGAKVYLRVFPDIPVCVKVWMDLNGTV